MSNNTNNILVLNGPNLNLLGTRKPEIYGSLTLSDIHDTLTEAAQEYGVTLDFKQSNSESEMVDWIQAARGKADGIIINPAAYSHTSVAIRDALEAVEIPVAEVHLSNIHAREEFRHNSYVSAVAKMVICGAGDAGYEYALDFLVSQIGSE
ncbi:type II 3-dehydroquinate dehydratase [Temperatibacter marinus]|uniref:3-dehydroquinate dehydratase n=1 Tax=Temperatibacter marinus TaxID=1456591 RepID=A0AA52HA72_9PROT|nr:type II 3-dehydroquinate dehydratase [Temperatibacter marinus]WND02288.1 type II 3-dehydroquinate dehydratase [Temperatibacter marinus]